MNLTTDEPSNLLGIGFTRALELYLTKNPYFLNLQPAPLILSPSPHGRPSRPVKRHCVEPKHDGVEQLDLSKREPGGYEYLQPSKKHLPVKEFITPEQFEKYEKLGKEMGFRHVESGPLVRSSYHAEKHIL